MSKGECSRRKTERKKEDNTRKKNPYLEQRGLTIILFWKPQYRVPKMEGKEEGETKEGLERHGGEETVGLR